MTSLINRLFGRRKRGSGATAKNRLHFVLQHDRINLPPERMEMMKRELLEVIAKYLFVDKKRVEIDLEQRDRTHSKLVAEIPFAPGQTSPVRIDAAAVAAQAEVADANGAASPSEAENGGESGPPDADGKGNETDEETARPDDNAARGKSSDSAASAS